MTRAACCAIRVVSCNNQHLGYLADGKSYILIKASGAMLSVLLTFAIQIEEAHPFILLPVSLALATCIGVIALSLLASTPKMAGIDAFAFAEYTRNSWQHPDDELRLYHTLIREIYEESVVLGRKYKYLRLSYLTFIIGLTAIVISSLVLVLLYPHR